MLSKFLTSFAVLITLALIGLYVIGSGAFGRRWGPEVIQGAALPAAEVALRKTRQVRAAEGVGVPDTKQILFGDLHVHTTYSLDAFMMALPSAGGEGAHPVADACDFARYCSSLDFWSINDHAMALTQAAWDETVDGIRQCNAVGGDGEVPDLTSFLGWEWTQMGTRPENHYGHKNVIVRGLADDAIPTRPIAARPPADAFDRQRETFPSNITMGLLALARPNQDSLDLIRYFRDMIEPDPCADGIPVRELPLDCQESVETPAELFAKLDDWGFDSMVIPHGTTWGFYTPQGSAWDKQLGAQHDPKRQTLIEVFSGHGNSEEYRDFREVIENPDGTRSCPEESDDYLPSCQRAGQIVTQRCLDAGESERICAVWAEEARQNYVDADIYGHRTVPGTEPDEWLDSGQCRDCFQPSFNYRPRSAVQYIMALRKQNGAGAPERFNFGFIAASDNHSARPGTGYKEYARTEMTEARLPLAGASAIPSPSVDKEARSRPFDPDAYAGTFFALREGERASSFFLTGGLVAVHADGRDRDAIWDGLARREVYGTSGPRTLLWFKLLNAPGTQGRGAPMGSSVSLSDSPIFQVRAVGSFEPSPGCPDVATRGLSSERLARLCHDECYHPSEERRRITRVEVVRIRPQLTEDEPISDLIEDPWRVLPCEADPAGCVVTFTDPDFERGKRDALYYVRAIEEPSLAVNANLLRCETDGDGKCERVRPCRDVPDTDDCLAKTEERAWSSPIFVSHGG